MAGFAQCFSLLWTMAWFLFTLGARRAAFYFPWFGSSFGMPSLQSWGGGVNVFFISIIHISQSLKQQLSWTSQALMRLVDFDLKVEGWGVFCLSILLSVEMFIYLHGSWCRRVKGSGLLAITFVWMQRGSLTTSRRDGGVVFVIVYHHNIKRCKQTGEEW